MKEPKPASYEVNDAVAFTYKHAGERYFRVARVIAVDAQGNPVVKYLEGKTWINLDNPPDRLSKVGRYRRLFGFLWHVFAPEETA